MSNIYCFWLGKLNPQREAFKKADLNYQWFSLSAAIFFIFFPVFGAFVFTFIFETCILLPFALVWFVPAFFNQEKVYKMFYGYFSVYLKKTEEYRYWKEPGKHKDFLKKMLKKAEKDGFDHETVLAVLADFKMEHLGTFSRADFYDFCEKYRTISISETDITALRKAKYRKYQKAYQHLLELFPLPKTVEEDRQNDQDPLAKPFSDHIHVSAESFNYKTPRPVCMSFYPDVLKMLRKDKDILLSDLFSNNKELLGRLKNLGIDPVDTTLKDLIDMQDFSNTPPYCLDKEEVDLSRKLKNAGICPDNAYFIKANIHDFGIPCDKEEWRRIKARRGFPKP